MKNTIYYLPGMGGHLGSGLGQGLLSRGYDVTVVPNVGHMLGKDYVGNLLDKWLR